MQTPKTPGKCLERKMNFTIQILINEIPSLLCDFLPRGAPPPELGLQATFGNRTIANNGNNPEEFSNYKSVSSAYIS